MRLIILVLSLVFLGGCQKYEIKYIGQTQITEQKIKLPDVGAPGHYDNAEGNNTAFQFTLENMKIESLNFDEHLKFEFFICGQRKFETDLNSALYLTKELKFAIGQSNSATDKSFYAVFHPPLLADIKESSDSQNKPLCARIVYAQPFELKKVSNTVKLGKLE